MYLTLNDLTELEILRAIFTLIFVGISLIVGLRIISKYRSYKNPELLTVGLTWIFLSSPWWPLPITFILILLFNYALEPMVYLYLMTAFVPAALICWIYSFSSLMYSKKKWYIFTPFLIVCAFYMVAYHIFLFIAPELIGTHQGGFQYSRSFLVNGFAVFSLIITFITAILFSFKSIRSEDKTVRWKGRFLLIGILAFVLGSILDLFSTGNPFLQTTNRIILTLSAVGYYLGFFLPQRVADVLIKEK